MQRHLMTILALWLPSPLLGGESTIWKHTGVVQAPEANQAAAADERFVYAIDNALVAKYDRKTGQRIAVSAGPAKHLNSGFLWNGRLFCAHSNYPRTPELSEIKVLDPKTMELSTFKDFGNYGGSLTWAVRYDGHWWCNFAHYGDDNRKTFLVKFDDDWKETGRWVYPPEVIRQLGRYSLSGGIWRNGSLLATGHDDPLLFELQLPKQGTMLEYAGRHKAPFTGQGIAVDPALGGLVGINRSKRQVVFAALDTSGHAPLALHSDNPHYFLFRGKPAVLITSAEHYGAVLNLDFDYKKYLDELHANRLNLTRTFTGVYVEDAKAFGIARNTLAPTEGKITCPWARSDTPGYAGGGNKFDLTRWDPAYFTRLKDFLTQAGKRGIVVEVTLFCPFYEDSMWKLSPMNSANNVNDVGKLARESVYNRTKNGGLQAIQENLVRRLVTELNGFDNLYYEVCNEPYFGGVTEDWQRRIIDVIVEAEKPLPNKHLISLNIANGTKKVEDPHPSVSIFNFHYASPPDAVRANYKLNKVIGDNETGFKGTADTHYRMEGWEFILAGGGLYNNLDYSFVAGHEDGSFAVPAKSPGGGNRGFRRQMKVLSDFIHGFDFVRMKPDDKVVKGGLPAKGRARVLSEPGKQYAVYLFGGPAANLALDLPPGRYQVDWVDPISGKVLQSGVVSATGPATELRSPRFDPDIALRVRRTD